MKVREQKISILASDGVNLALWNISGTNKVFQGKEQQHVLLTHGTCSDRRICLGVARYLARAGCVCWILEWREHGSSRDSNTCFNFETVALMDLRSAVDYIYSREPSKPIAFVGHSGGGILLAILLSRVPELESRFSRVVFVATQAFSGAWSMRNRIVITLYKALSFVLGSIPGPLFGLGPHHEKYYLMNQWFQWNLRNRFCGSDGFDYRKRMSAISLPILALSANADRYIAPPRACREFLDSFGGNESKFLVCGLNTGFSENFSHSRILLSRTSSREIWPLIKDWVIHSETSGVS